MANVKDFSMPPPKAAVPGAAQIVIGMDERGNINATYPQNIVLTLGLLELAKNMAVKQLQEQQERRVTPATMAFGPLNGGGR